jgi:hypothetical protein
MTQLLMKLSAIYETGSLLLCPPEPAAGACPELCENPIGRLPVHLDRVLFLVSLSWIKVLAFVTAVLNMYPTDFSPSTFLP